jgi:hypothetical protein
MDGNQQIRIQICEGPDPDVMYTIRNRVSIKVGRDGYLQVPAQNIEYLCSGEWWV